MCQQSFVFNDIYRKFNKKFKPKSKSPKIVFSKFKSYKTFSIVTFKKPEYTVQQQKRKLFSAKESYKLLGVTVQS